MNRRTFLKGIGAAGVLAAGHGLAAPEKPNIIFIMVDDMGIGDVGCYGSKKVKTPNVDRMATEGTRFTDCYAGSAVCGPTRCTLLTGLHSGHATRRGNRAKANPPGTGKDRGLVPLRASDVTIGTVLKKAGYVTGAIGKWGLGNPGTTGTPEKHGFDFFYGYLDQVHAHNYYTDHLYRNTVSEPIESKVYAHNLFEKETEGFLRKYKDKPFFLYLPYTLPHGKYVVPSDAPYSDEKWPQMVKNYAAMCTLADTTVGKILGWLTELGIDERTLVFFTSDNGPNKPFLAPLNSGGGFRGTK
ncbi:sulfatase-like hydrolase/transferase, partial [bacterium]|nr:sulfatase-like hydrolase/transferase [bacterium]